MGFCIFNNIAIAARYALAQGLERVMVIDYDAHHGNGTQAAFLDDERLAFLQNALGGVPGPMDCYLALRGTKTLAVRMQAHCVGARAVAEFLGEGGDLLRSERAH